MDTMQSLSAGRDQIMGRDLGIEGSWEGERVPVDLERGTLIRMGWIYSLSVYPLSFQA